MQIIIYFYAIKYKYLNWNGLVGVVGYKNINSPEHLSRRLDLH